jgi:hypothetical protein
MCLKVIVNGDCGVARQEQRISRFALRGANGKGSRLFVRRIEIGAE